MGSYLMAILYKICQNRIHNNMPKKQVIQLFEERKVRTVWDDEHRSGLIKP